MAKSSKKVVVAPKAAVVEAQDTKFRAPNCSVNFHMVVNFDESMAKLGLTKDSSVNNIMLALYENYGTDLNPNVTARQIREFKGEGCKCSAGCISWYKNHYRPELRKFVSTKKKGASKDELIEKIMKHPSMKNSPVLEFIPSLSLTKLQEIAEKLG